jgi:hypothetical protein
MKKILLLSFSALTSLSLFAQCTVSSSNGTNVSVPNGFLFGQSFTATCSGKLDYVEYISNENSSFNADTLKIYSGSTVSTTPIYVQPFASMNVTVGQPIRITLSGNVPITNGNQYTFEFYVDVNVLANFSDVYAGGTPFQDGVQITTADLDFNAHIIPASGIDDLEFASRFSLYPNPAGHSFSINAGTSAFEGKYELMSFDGQVIRTGNIDQQVSKISIDELPAGIYFLRILAENKSASFKIVHTN